MNKCCNCFHEKNYLVYLALYGYLCSECYQDIIRDYLK